MPNAANDDDCLLEVRTAGVFSIVTETYYPLLI
jgi:hypothetical protein